MNIDQKILDKAILLNDKEIELIETAHDWELYMDTSFKYGVLYHDLFEMCKCDHAFFSLYRILAESLHEENYERAATIKKQIEMTEPLKQFILDRSLYK